MLYQFRKTRDEKLDSFCRTNAISAMERQEIMCTETRRPYIGFDLLTNHFPCAILISCIPNIDDCLGMQGAIKELNLV